MSEGFFKANATYLFRTAVDFLFRRRLPGLILVRIGGTLLLAVLLGFAVKATILTDDGAVNFIFTTEGTPNWLVIGVFIIAGILIGTGIIWTSRNLHLENRKRVIVTELRGLRDIAGRPLIDAVPNRLTGRREQLLIDLRQGQDGKLSEPNAALRAVVSLPNDIASRERGLDRSDITHVVGGLAPVPFSFLVGLLIDDEETVMLMDWNRHIQEWCELDAPDDGKRFVISGLDALPNPISEVALAVSVSYAIDIAGVKQKLPSIPLVEMKLEDGSPDAHWSEIKQAALGKQFLETMIGLGNCSVQTVHLFLAAPNSLVLRLGRLYDKRNLPTLIAYQYDRQESPPYPWGIRMPVEGAPDAGVIS